MSNLEKLVDVALLLDGVYRSLSGKGGSSDEAAKCISVAENLIYDAIKALGGDL